MSYKKCIRCRKRYSDITIYIAPGSRTWEVCSACYQRFYKWMDRTATDEEFEDGLDDLIDAMRPILRKLAEND